MTYTVGCRWLDRTKEQFTFQTETAKEALAEAEKVAMSDARIEYIDTPEDGRCDMAMLRVLAKEVPIDHCGHE
jgi:hypothetical protein